MCHYERFTWPEEIVVITKKIKNKRAPGTDSTPNSATKPAMSANALNACLREQIFPDKWQQKTLVVLPKPYNPPQKRRASSFAESLAIAMGKNNVRKMDVRFYPKHNAMNRKAKRQGKLLSHPGHDCNPKYLYMFGYDNSAN